MLLQFMPYDVNEIIFNQLSFETLIMMRSMCHKLKNDVDKYLKTTKNIKQNIFDLNIICIMPKYNHLSLNIKQLIKIDTIKELDINEYTFNSNIEYEINYLNVEYIKTINLLRTVNIKINNVYIKKNIYDCLSHDDIIWTKINKIEITFYEEDYTISDYLQLANKSFDKKLLNIEYIKIQAFNIYDHFNISYFTQLKNLHKLVLIEANYVYGTNDIIKSLKIKSKNNNLVVDFDVIIVPNIEYIYILANVIRNLNNISSTIKIIELIIVTYNNIGNQLSLLPNLDKLILTIECYNQYMFECDIYAKHNRINLLQINISQDIVFDNMFNNCNTIYICVSKKKFTTHRVYIKIINSFKDTYQIIIYCEHNIYVVVEGLLQNRVNILRYSSCVKIL